MKMKQSETAGLKHIKKTKIMASSPITLSKEMEEKMETMTDFSFLASFEEKQ